MVDLEKLPKWAQNHIDALQLDRDYWRETSKSLGYEGETNTVIDDYPTMIQLPPDSTIMFGTEERKKTCVQWDESNQSVRVTPWWSNGLLVRPVTGNVVLISARSD